MADDPVLERLVRERIEGAASPAETAAVLLGFVAARMTAIAGERATAKVLYALADRAAAGGAAPGEVA